MIRHFYYLGQPGYLANLPRICVLPSMVHCELVVVIPVWLNPYGYIGYGYTSMVISVWLHQCGYIGYGYTSMVLSVWLYQCGYMGYG